MRFVICYIRVMAITSTSTVAEVLAQYNNNLAWEGDPISAAAALAAVRWLLVNRPAYLALEGQSMTFSALEKEKARLEAFVDSTTATSSSRKKVGFVRARAGYYGN